MSVKAMETVKNGKQAVPITGSCSRQSCTKFPQTTGEQSNISNERPAIVHDVLSSPGTSLDQRTLNIAESWFSHDFSRVRVHSDEKAAESAQAMNARAYAVGRDLVFGQGQYSPGTEKGRRLLAHELTHVVQQKSDAAYALMPQYITEGPENTSQENEAERMGNLAALDKSIASNKAMHTQPQFFAGTAINQAPPSVGTDIGARHFVESAITFLETSAHANQISVEAKESKYDETALELQLKHWKAMLDKSQGIIDSALGNDATLGENLKSAYQEATSTAIKLAASRLNRPGLTIYQQYRHLIAEWALPRTVAEPKADELSGMVPEHERKKLTVITSSVNFNVDELFSTKIATTTIPFSQGVTTRFASAIPKKLQHGLRNVAATIIPKPLELNSTTSIVLDLWTYGGDCGLYRFTYLEHTPKKAKASKEVLIEKLGSIGMEETFKSQAETAKKLANHGFIRGSGWSDQEFASVHAAIEQIADSILSPVNGLTFERAQACTADPDAGGTYNPETHTICIYDRALQNRNIRFGAPGAGVSTDTVRSIAHEIGHAVDLLPLRQAWENLKQKQEALNNAFMQFENPPGSKIFKFPNSEQAKYNKLKAAINAAEKTLKATRSESGERYVKDKNGTFQMVEAKSDVRSNEFRKAALKDGSKRITTYSDKEWQEYYAESFSMYITDSETLRRLRPNVFAFFTRKHPN